ncbi:hypothetical protein HYH03_002257 [Edaphochlamys debaryana]|uniref:Cytochrome c-553 n=1 Tax=Edaphochlamys debaryana TaxID=47281 RepID=A0A835YE59_9CHLO|nr:hypothetical protein HYH03_002257 [Edaphochlamys debaryana]|eukprot:KAG2499972.1 hypothetical protein HYH03_002257 [Edaphochlamys debaryana]
MAFRAAAQPKLRAGSAPAARSRNVAVASASSRAPVAVSLLSAAALLLAGAPNAARAADLALGEQVFNGNCAACHMGGRNSVIPDRTLDKAALEAYLEGGFSVEAITYQVRDRDQGLAEEAAAGPRSADAAAKQDGARQRGPVAGILEVASVASAPESEEAVAVGAAAAEGQQGPADDGLAGLRPRGSQAAAHACDIARARLSFRGAAALGGSRMSLALCGRLSSWPAPAPPAMRA